MKTQDFNRNARTKQKAVKHKKKNNDCLNIS